MKRYYRTIDQKANRVDSLINEMFRLLKMEDADYTLNREQTDIWELLRQVCADYYEEVAGAGLDFQIEIPEEQIFVWIDRGETVRVIENLLGNAVKYNQTGSQVEVCAAYRDSQGNSREIEILVRDDGEPIAEDIRQILFDPFVRGDQARRSKGGTGLGLAIAYKIMEMQGGKLEYRCEDGKNVFCVSIKA